MTNTPSETEIDNLLCKHWPGYSRQAVLVKMWLREAIESAIAKWAAPQQEAQEPDHATFALWYANHIGDENKPVREAAWETYQAFAGRAVPQPAPAPLSACEIELLDGMIDAQLKHAQRCDSIPNRPMAEKQKGWDMERVTLLRKLKATMGGQQP